MKKLYLCILFLLTGCLEDKESKQAKDLCFEIYPAEKFSGQIMLNKCTGESWMLVTTTLMDNGKKTGAFTYRWYPLSSSNYGEPEMTRGNN